MTTRLKPGKPKTWGGQIDQEGHWTFNADFLVYADFDDGPFNVLTTPGLPLPGAPWAYGNDLMVWAFCQPACSAKSIVSDGEKTAHWIVSKTFSTKPVKRCGDTQVTDPLLEPPKVTGNYNRRTVEATEDRFGIPVLNSSHEQIRGPQVEFDEDRGVIEIEQNIVSFELAVVLPAMLNNHVNDQVLWGIPARCVKLSVGPWEQLYHGMCQVYFKRKLRFDINMDTWDRNIADEGTKVLNGRWDPNSDAWLLVNVGTDPPDAGNPRHFIKAVDRQGNPMRMLLNGAGLPAGVVTRTSEEDLGVYVSLENDNTGNALDDDTSWLPGKGTIPPEAWEQFTLYETGWLVTHNGATWIAIQDSVDEEPAFGDFWIELDNGLSDLGEYDEATTYDRGDYVTSADVQGNIHVEKYHEANLLILGIPTILGV